MLAEMMRFHTSGVEDPEVAVTEGLGVVQAVGRALGEENPYAKAMLSEMERIVRRNKAVTFHDDLSPEMKPLLFSDFIKRARAHGLQFLAEADYTTMIFDDLPADARTALEEIRDDAVRREQYLDFFKLRRLRETLLCRADLNVLPGSLHRGIRRSLFWCAARTENASAITRTRSGRICRPAQYVGDGGAAVRQGGDCNLVRIMARSACATRRSSTVLQSGFRNPIRAGRRCLSELLMKMYGAGLMEIDTQPWPYPSDCAETPCVSQLARFQAREGLG